MSSSYTTLRFFVGFNVMHVLLLLNIWTRTFVEKIVCGELNGISGALLVPVKKYINSYIVSILVIH